MKILGIDTSSLSTSVSVVEDNKVICEYTVNTKKTHSQKLMVMIENMFKVSDINIDEIDLIAVCEGPGSFTGLRIAMATAKSIAHAKDIKIVAVNSLEILAGNINICEKKICSILDAQRNQVYFGKYEYKNNELVEIDKIGVTQIDELLNSLDSEWIMVGEAVYKYVDKISEYKNLHIPNPSHLINRASCLCSIALNKYKNNLSIYNSQTANLNYIRKSQAELDYEKKNEGIYDKDRKND